MKKENFLCSICGENIKAYSDLLYSHGGEYLWWVFEEHNKKCTKGGNKNGKV